ncbi:MAG: type VI secretion system Vgr family protein [Candidatus Binataceae bacterium]
MASSYSQQDRLIEIETPLGQDVLLLQEFSGIEGVSRLFSFKLVMLSENPSISFSEIVGKQVTITLKTPGGGESRYINGYVSRFTQAGNDPRFTYYHAEVVPWLWFLTRIADCRIFQNKTIPDIIVQVFQSRGFSDFSDKTQGSYPQRDYCVQYRETDFNFVSRLMEQYGIHYFFQHADGRHTLVMADSSTAHQPCPSQSTAKWYETAGEGGLPEDEDVVTGFEIQQELRAGKYALQDYNFETPSTSLLANANSTVQAGNNSQYEIYDYPGDYETTSEGNNIVGLRIEEEEAVNMVATGVGTCRSFIPGYTFTLAEHYRQDLNQSYLLTEAEHAATVGDGYTSGNMGAAAYSNKFICIPGSTTLRPMRTTPRPRVQGPQTAVVVGPAGQEVYVDKYGRVKVQFFWDRQGQHDDKSSCWIRVSQPWAGKTWGGITIPRIGQEVVVDFLEGDPDRPIITGRVYNAEQMPPYKLPDDQTRSTLKSRSSTQGGSDNYNEIRFEDKKGSEQLFVRAEMDMDERVKQDLREFVGGKRSLMVQGDQLEQVQGAKHAKVTGEYRHEVGGNLSLNVIGNRDEKVGMNYAVKSGEIIHLNAGMTVVIEAGMTLTLKAGSGFVTIGPEGVAIQGAMVMINSGGAAGSAPDASPQAPEQPDTADDGTKGTKLS